MDAVLDQAEEYLTDTPAFEFASPFPTLEQAQNDPELKWRKKVQNPESLRTAILKAQGLRDSISGERADAIAEKFLRDDQNGGGHFLSQQTQRMRALKDTSGLPSGLCGFHLLLPALKMPPLPNALSSMGTRPLRGKKSDWDKIQAVAWGLGRTLGLCGDSD